ncbi:MAG: SH3 domain-containing protein, partial [Cutibacterium granulosum]|nr:SH3 domain-containing protein [Cutibacterium granulosum]
MATTAVNVRSGPGTSYKILGVLYPGHTAQQIGNTRYGWAQVTWKGHTAYVAAQYLRGSSAAGSSSTHVTLRPSPGVPKAAPVSGSVVRPVVGQKRSTAVLMVRSSYTNHFGSEGDAPIGTIFNVTGRTANGLAEVIWQGRPRWVNAKYLTSVNAHRPARHNAPIKPGRATKPSTPGKSTRTSKQAKPRTPARPAKPSTPAKPVVRPVVGQARGTTALMIRTSFTSHFGTEGDAPSGTIFDVTGRKANGMAEVIWQGRPRWVNAKYLTPVGSPKPKPSKPRTPAKPA